MRHVVAKLLPAASLVLGASCSDPGGPPGGQGTGGDDQMPEDPDPGPAGLGCPPVPAMVVQDTDPARLSQPTVDPRPLLAFVNQSLAGRGVRATALDRPDSVSRDVSPLPATTPAPHEHERWSEARRLELSYCINGIPGEDAEQLDNYEELIRIAAGTVAEWERASGTNFIHVGEWDRPFEDAHVTLVNGGPEFIARPQCEPGNDALFGLIAQFPTGIASGSTNAIPQLWNSPGLEPQPNGVMGRKLQLNSSFLVSSVAKSKSTYRHEIGHVVGFDHEEVTISPIVENNSCNDPDPRALVPGDSRSIMTTSECPGGSETEFLSAGDRLSAFLLYHTGRFRFETRGAGLGYRFIDDGGGTGGAQVLWHARGAASDELWTPLVGAAGVSFTTSPVEYFPGSPPQDWFPNENEVVVPARLDGDEDQIDLLFHGPGPGQDFAVLTSNGQMSAVEWQSSEFVVPIVGAFDANDLSRDQIYLYGPGPMPDSAVRSTMNGAGLQAIPSVPTQDAFAYPIVGPFRGMNLPDDIIWFNPLQHEFELWVVGDNVLDVLVSTMSVEDAGLSGGELVPVVGDFNGDRRADIMWHGVAALPGFSDISDVLWLSTSTPLALQFDTIDKAVGNSFRPFVGDFDGDGVDDIFWHRSWEMTSDGASADATGPSYIWYFDEAGGHDAEVFGIQGDYSPYVGDFDADGCDDIGWFDAVNDAFHVWRCIPGQRDFECGEAIAAPADAAPVGVHWGF